MMVRKPQPSKDSQTKLGTLYSARVNAMSGNSTILWMTRSRHDRQGDKGKSSIRVFELRLTSSGTTGWASSPFKIKSPQQLRVARIRVQRIKSLVNLQEDHGKDVSFDRLFQRSDGPIVFPQAHVNGGKIPRRYKTVSRK